MRKIYLLRARRLTRRCYIACGGDEEATKAMIKANIKEVGNPLLVLMVVGAILQICYYAVKLWKEWHVTTPAWRPVMGEPFELCKGEKYELTELELARFRQELEAANEF